MARKQRVETYLEAETVEQLDDLETPNSEFIRDAVTEKLGVEA